MNLLFVSRSKGGHPSPIIKAQGSSLQIGADNYFLITGRGPLGYLTSILKLRRMVRKMKIKIIHAHYSLSGYIAALSFACPVVCSLMGSDIQVSGIKKEILRLFARYFWSAVIVKSQKMKEALGIKNAVVIPNGVDLNMFRPIERDLALKNLGLDPKSRWIIFLADPNRKEKNFNLAKDAVKLLHNDDIQLLTVYNVDHSVVPFYLSAADVLVLTSLREGSPNAVKEAMACNCPIVSTDVGDVKEVIGNTAGCYIADFNPKDIADKLTLALQFGTRTSGRNDIQHLDSKLIAGRLKEVYASVFLSKQ